MRRRHIILILILIAGACASVRAQRKTASTETVKAPVEKTAAQLEAERILSERRASAQSLLVNLATDARNFSDATLRARTQSKIADLLWDTDHDRSKSMFLSAWTRLRSPMPRVRPACRKIFDSNKLGPVAVDL